MALQELLAELERLKVELVADGDRLRYRPRQRVTPALRKALVARKRELLSVVAGRDADVRWRLEAMRPGVPPTGPIPTLYARRLGRVPDDCCLSCGEGLTPGNKYRCEPCVRAAWHILREVRGRDGSDPVPDRGADE